VTEISIYRNTVTKNKICYNLIFDIVNLSISCSAFDVINERALVTIATDWYFLNVAVVLRGLPSITSAADHVAWTANSLRNRIQLICETKCTELGVLWMNSWMSYGDWLTIIYFPRRLILYLDQEIDQIHLAGERRSPS